MKKFRKLVTATVLSTAMMFSLCACGSDSTSTTAAGGSSESGGGAATEAAKPSGGVIKVGVVNNPPSESGYREANVKDMEKVFSAENGYELKTSYSLKNDEQLQAAQGFITEGVD